MVGTIRDSANLNNVVGYRIVDIDTGQNGNYPQRSLENVLKQGHNIENLRLKYGKIELERGLQVDKFPAIVLDKNGGVQVVSKKPALVVLGRLSNGNIKVIKLSGDTYEITSEQLRYLIMTKGFSLQNANIKMGKRLIEVIQIEKPFLLDEPGYQEQFKRDDTKQQAQSTPKQSQTPQQPKPSKPSTPKQAPKQSQTKKAPEVDIDGINELKKHFVLMELGEAGFTLLRKEDGVNWKDIGNTLVIPEGIIQLGSYSFEKSTIEKIVMPKQLRGIGKYAFSRQSIKEVVLQEGIEVIKAGAFYDSEITQINFPKQLKIIESRAFYGLNLQDIVLEGQLEEIGESAFMMNKAKSLVINAPKCVVKAQAFSGQLIETVNILGVRRIKEAAFKFCESLEEFETHGEIIEIGTEVFSRCPNIRNIRLGHGVKYLQPTLAGQVVFLDTDDRQYKHLFIPNDAIIKDRSSKQTNFQLDNFTIHVDFNSDVHKQIVKSAYNAGTLSRLKMVDTGNNQCKVSEIALKKASIIGKKVYEIYEDRVDRENKKYTQDNRFIDSEEFNWPQLDTQKFLSGIKLQPELNSLVGYEVLPNREFKRRDWEEFWGIKTLNWITTCFECDAQITSQARLYGLRFCGVNRKRVLVIPSMGIQLISLNVLHRAFKESIFINLIINEDREILYQFVSGEEISRLYPPGDEPINKKVLLDSNIVAGDTITGQLSIATSGSIMLFGQHIDGNDQTRLQTKIIDTIRSYTVGVMHGQKETYFYYPQIDWVIKVSEEGDRLLSHGYRHSNIMAHVLEQSPACESQMFKAETWDNKAYVKMLNDILDLKYDTIDSDPTLRVQKVAKIAEIADKQYDTYSTIRSERKLELADLQLEQLIDLMDSEVLEPVTKEYADGVLAKCELYGRENKYTLDRCSLTVRFLKNGLRYKKIAAQKSSNDICLAGGAKAAIYILETKDKTYYSKTTYQVMDLEFLITQLVKYGKNLQLNDTNARLFKIADAGTYFDNSRRISINTARISADIGNKKATVNRRIRVEVMLNPVNGCTYLLVGRRWADMHAVLPMEQLEAGLMFLNDVRKTNEAAIMDYLDNAVYNIWMSITSNKTQLYDLVLNREISRQAYKDLMRSPQSLYKYIALNNKTKFREQE